MHNSDFMYADDFQLFPLNADGPGNFLTGQTFVHHVQDVIAEKVSNFDSHEKLPIPVRASKPAPDMSYRDTLDIQQN